MNWEAAGAIGEIVGAGAVVATLAYLATQVSLARKATIADIYQGRATSRAELAIQIATSCGNFHDILFRFETLEKERGGVVALAAMSDEDRHVLSHYYSSLAIRMDNVCFQYEAGFLPESYLASIRNGILRFGPIWQELETPRPAELQAFMDREPL